MYNTNEQIIYYDPKIGRFISPAEVSNLNPNSINGLTFYAYAISNPVCIAYSSVFVGSIVTAVVVGTIVAVGISVAGAFVINYLGGMLDDEWKKFKEQIFE